MKKAKLIPLIFTIFIAGCSTDEATSATNPTDVSVGNDVLSYYDTKSDITDNIYKLITFYDSALINLDFDNSIDVVLNDDEEIRAIYINTEDAITYQNISIGDSKTKVKDSYLYETEYKNYVLVLFDGETEVDSTVGENENEYIWINYRFDDDNILYQISIYDYSYGRYSR